MEIKKNVEEIKNKFSGIFIKNKKNILILLVGILGLFFIFISSDKKSDSENIKNVDSKSNIDTSTENYVKNLEEKVRSILEKVEGVGQANVMISLNNGIEYVYAGEEKKNSDKTEDIGQNDSVKVKKSDNYEQKLILVDGPNGKRQPLVKTMIEPSIKGVLVVCTGGEDISVQDRVVEALTTVLGISSNKVSIIKLS